MIGKRGTPGAGVQGSASGPESISVCPSCENWNAGGEARCVECGQSLVGVFVVSEERAREMGRRRRLVRRRNRLIVWGLAASIVAVLATLAGLGYAGASRELDPPTSSITATPSLNDWPMYQRDPAHAAVVDRDLAPLKGVLKWRFDTGEPVLSSPAVLDGLLYLGTGDHRIIAVDAGTGELVWEHAVDGPVDSSPAVAGGLVYVGLRDGRLIALNAANGELGWEFQTEGSIFSSPAVHRGELYVASSGGVLHALDAVTGLERWRFETDGRLISSPAAYEQWVAVTSHDRYLYILDSSTGRPALKFKTASAAGSPVFDEDFLFLADATGVIRSIDWRKQNRRFERLILRFKIQMAAWGLTDVIPNQAGYVWGIGTGKSSFIGAPVVAKEIVYLASTTGRLLALDKATGETVWEYDTAGSISGSPSVAGETVYIGDSLGRLYALDAISGERLWEFPVGGAISSTPVIAGGVIYFSSMDGNIYAVE